MWFWIDQKRTKQNLLESDGRYEPIKALGVYYTYDLKLLREKNFTERLDSIKNVLIFGLNAF